MSFGSVLDFVDEATLERLQQQGRRSRAPRRRAAERRSELIAAAVAVIAERGIAALRLEDVARRVGVGKTTVYLYFPTREDLVDEAVRGIVAAHLDPAGWSASDPLAGSGLELFCRRLSEAAGRPEVGAVIGAGASLGPEESLTATAAASEAIGRLTDALEVLLTNACDREALDTRALAAVVVTTTLFSARFPWLLPPVEPPPPDAPVRPIALRVLAALGFIP